MVKKGFFNKRNCMIIAVCAAIIIVLTIGVTFAIKSKSQKTEDKKSKPKDTQEVVTESVPVEETKTLSDFLGKTVGDVKAYFGENFVFEGQSGSMTMDYEGNEIRFYLNTYIDNPSDSEKVIIAASYGASVTIDSLRGNMLYGEIVSAVGEEASLEAPVKFYNELYGEWEYTLSFVYKEYQITYTWLEDPETNLSAGTWIQSNDVEQNVYDNQNETEEVQSEETVPTEETQSENAVQTEDTNQEDFEILTPEAAEMIDKALAYMQTNYSDQKISELEFYADYEGVIICYIISEYNYGAFFGAEIEKATGRVGIYNSSGREIDSFVLE